MSDPRRFIHPTFRLRSNGGVTMVGLSGTQRVRVDELLDVLLDIPAQERADYLNRHGGADPQVRREVESLLQAAEQVGEFSPRPQA